MALPVPSFLTDRETNPEEDRLWDSAAQLLANWAPTVRIREAFMTDIAVAQSQAESRRGLVDKPFRVVTFEFLGLNRRDSSLIEALLLRLGHGRFPMPLYPDFVKLTDDAVVGETFLEVSDTANRRFQVGGRVLIATLQRQVAELPTVETAKIVSVSANQIEVDAVGGSGILNPYPAQSRVYPIIEARTILQVQTTLLSDEMIRVTIEATETEGKPALDVLAAAGTVPAGFLTFQSLPIWTFKLNRAAIRLAVKRPGRYARVARGDVLELKGTRPRFEYAFSLQLGTRQEIFDFLKFAHGRVGALFAFWMPSPLAEYKLIAVDSFTQLRVEAYAGEIDWDFRPFCALTLRDGSVLVADIASVSRSAGVDTLTLGTPLPSLPATSDVRRASLAVRCRFKSDELVQQWLNDELVRINVTVVELVDEIANIVTPDLDTINSGAVELPPWEQIVVCCDDITGDQFGFKLPLPGNDPDGENFGDILPPP